MQRPPPLIDPNTGAVSVVLVPYHLDRLQGEWRGDPPPEGFPFPIRTDVEGSVFTFRPGRPLQEIAANTPLECNQEREFEHMHAYAITRAGWALHVGIGFEDERLRYFSLSNFRTSDDSEDVLARIAEVTGCLGDYDKRLHTTWFKVREAKGSERVDGHVWRRPWGVVSVFFESGHNPCFNVRWSV